MTSYGTIPTQSLDPTVPSSSSNLEYVSRAKERIKAGLGTRRPWNIMFNPHSFGFPSKFADAIKRVRTNVAYFRMNYAIIVLLVLFLSLLWHPISLIVFIVMMIVWLFLYFIREEPLVLFNRTIDDRIVLMVLGVLTIVFLFLTHATANILWALLVGAVLVVVHAALRKTDDLFLDEEQAGLLPGSSS